MSYPAAYEEDLSRLFFEPDEHPKNMLKTFQEFIQRFQLRYDALCPDSPEVSLEAPIERWKITTATPKNASRKPSLEQFDEICKQKNHATKFRSFYECIHPIDYTLICVWLHQRRKQEKIHTGVILFKQ